MSGQPGRPGPPIRSLESWRRHRTFVLGIRVSGIRQYTDFLRQPSARPSVWVTVFYCCRISVASHCTMALGSPISSPRGSRGEVFLSFGRCGCSGVATRACLVAHAGARLSRTRPQEWLTHASGLCMQVPSACALADTRCCHRFSSSRRPGGSGSGCVVGKPALGRAMMPSTTSGTRRAAGRWRPPGMPSPHPGTERWTPVSVSLLHLWNLSGRLRGPGGHKGAPRTPRLCPQALPRVGRWSP